MKMCVVGDEKSLSGSIKIFWDTKLYFTNFLNNYRYNLSNWYNMQISCSRVNTQKGYKMIQVYD